MTSITISDDLYRNLEQSAKLSNTSLHNFVEQALNWAISKAKRPKSVKYKLKSVDELPKEIQDIIGIAKDAKVKDDDLNGDDARWEYLKEKYNL